MKSIIAPGVVPSKPPNTAEIAVIIQSGWASIWNNLCAPVAPLTTPRAIQVVSFARIATTPAPVAATADVAAIIEATFSLTLAYNLVEVTVLTISST